MHTMVVVLGVFVNIILIMALLSIIIGLVWIISPLKDKHYLDSVYEYQYYTPLGGRNVGLIILGIGFICLTLGILLDRSHVRLARKFGTRI